MKKTLCVVMALCMVLTLASCGTGAGKGNAVEIGGPVARPGNVAPGAPSGGGYALSAVAFPETLKYPDGYLLEPGSTDDNGSVQKAWNDWGAQRLAKKLLAEGYEGMLDHYLAISAEYLKGNDGKNAVCSPLNIYFALAILAECSEGNTRAEILNVLGAADLAELRTVAKALWEQAYYDAGIYKTDLASSIWMNNEVNGVVPEFDTDTIATLAMDYYVTAYSGNAEDKGFSRAFKDWLNEHTGGLLKDSVESLDDFESDLVVAIASTVYLKASWEDNFNDKLTADDVFRSLSGDRNVPFMHDSKSLRTCIGDGFTAVFIPFTDSLGGMWIILPDEGITPEQLNSDGTIWAVVHDASPLDREDKISDVKLEYNYKLVDLTIPKFDVKAEIDLIDALKRMGIQEAFDPQNADFSGIIKNVQAYVSSAAHAARVKIDEEGCEAAAFTVITVFGSGLIPDRMEFKADRPFAFAITGSDGLPLFTGIVNEP